MRAPLAPLPQHPCARCCSGAKTPGPSKSTVPVGIIPTTHALGEEDTLLKYCTALSRCPGGHPLSQTAAIHGCIPQALCHGEGQREKPA